MKEITETRNADFRRRVEEIQRQGGPWGSRISERRAVSMAIEGGAPSFYLSREHVWKQLQRRRHGAPPREKPHRAAMWDEISAALEERVASHPRESRWEALDYVLAHHRPSRYFITEEYAVRIVRKRENTEKHTPLCTPAPVRRRRKSKSKG